MSPAALAAADNTPADEDDLLYITRITRDGHQFFVVSVAGMPIYEVADAVLNEAKAKGLGFAADTRVVVATTTDRLFCAVRRLGEDTTGTVLLDEDGHTLEDRLVAHVAWLAQSACIPYPILSTIRAGGEAPLVLTAGFDGELLEYGSVRFFRPEQVELETAVPLTPMRLRAWHAAANR